MMPPQGPANLSPSTTDVHLYMPAERPKRASKQHRSKFLPPWLWKDGEHSQSRHQVAPRRTGDTSNNDIPSSSSGVSHRKPGRGRYPNPESVGFPEHDYRGPNAGTKHMPRDWQGLEQLVKELRQELDFTKKELSSAKQELQLSRVFGNRADNVSEADIRDKALRLSDSIYQLASAIADPIDNAYSASSRGSVSESARRLFGDPLVKLVRRSNLDGPSLSALLQACLIHFCYKVLSYEFASIVDSERNEILQSIFDNMKASSELKIVSARWRSLAHLHVQNLQDQQKLCQLLIRRLTELYGFPLENFELSYGEGVSDIVNMTLDLHKMIYRDYVSGDIVPFTHSPGSPFDSEHMVVDDPRGGTQKVDGPIFCSTGIGLTRTMIVRRGQGDSWVEQEDRLVLLKAKVLMSSDDEIILI
ncbi:hypothetical protein AX15_002035 [Amanita polypyramis BW_CC]|nr:hypothetical protein AX15_002035 [Amanita polypyramis BW_CC]